MVLQFPCDGAGQQSCHQQLGAVALLQPSSGDDSPVTRSFACYDHLRKADEPSRAGFSASLSMDFAPAEHISTTKTHFHVASAFSSAVAVLETLLLRRIERAGAGVFRRARGGAS